MSVKQKNASGNSCSARYFPTTVAAPSGRHRSRLISRLGSIGTPASSSASRYPLVRSRDAAVPGDSAEPPRTPAPLEPRGISGVPTAAIRRQPCASRCLREVPRGRDVVDRDLAHDILVDVTDQHERRQRASRHHGTVVEVDRVEDQAVDEVRAGLREQLELALGLGRGLLDLHAPAALVGELDDQVDDLRGVRPEQVGQAPARSCRSGRCAGRGRSCSARSRARRAPLHPGPRLGRTNTTPLMTFDTVFGDTPASLATSLTVARMSPIVTTWHTKLSRISA